MCVSALVIVAGTAVPVAFGQYNSKDDQRQNQQQQQMEHGRNNPDQRGTRQDQTTNLRFVSLDDLDGSSITNANGDEVGTVSDLIIERGGDEVDYVVVKTGSWLGIGGTEVGVPYSRFGWDAQNKRLTLDLSKDELKTRPEFSKDRWDTDVNQPRGWNDRDRPADRQNTPNGSNNDQTNNGHNNDRKANDRTAGANATLADELLGHNNPERSDPYAAQIRGAKAVSINGTVSSIERRPVMHTMPRDRANPGGVGAGDEVVATIDTDTGMKKVVLGPSWYVMGSDATPMRDDVVTISAFQIGQDGGTTYVARTFQDRGRTLSLRDERGQAMWIGEHSEGNLAGNLRAHYMLFSDLNGKTVQCRGETCGDVADVIMEGNSGRAAFLSIDPDQNFLGIADTNRLIPMNVVSVTTQDKVVVDASKEMILNSRKAPDDLTSLSQQDINAIYGAFDVHSPTFSPQDESRRNSELSSYE